MVRFVIKISPSNLFESMLLSIRFLSNFRLLLAFASVHWLKPSVAVLPFLVIALPIPGYIIMRTL